MAAIGEPQREGSWFRQRVESRLDRSVRRKAVEYEGWRRAVKVGIRGAPDTRSARQILRIFTLKMHQGMIERCHLHKQEQRAQQKGPKCPEIHECGA